MHTLRMSYTHHDQELSGYLAYEKDDTQKRPGILVAHDWTGCNEFACKKAEMLAELGYVGFALDMYGEGRLGANNEQKMALMSPVVSDRALLRDRLLVALETLKASPMVDKNKIAIIGFCFGGLCALDLARSGADIKGAVSFHGLLGKPEGLKSEVIKAKVLVLHGYDDPMAKPDQVESFCTEMTEAQADWQVHMYGKVKHAFTNPLAHDRELGLIFDELAAKRSWRVMQDFFEEIFQDAHGLK